jgi:hypothetical protein
VSGEGVFRYDHPVPALASPKQSGGGSVAEWDRLSRCPCIGASTVRLPGGRIWKMRCSSLFSQSLKNTAPYQSNTSPVSDFPPLQKQRFWGGVGVGRASIPIRASSIPAYGRRGWGGLTYSFLFRSSIEGAPFVQLDRPSRSTGSFIQLDWTGLFLVVFEKTTNKKCRTLPTEYPGSACSQSYPFPQEIFVPLSFLKRRSTVRPA